MLQVPLSFLFGYFTDFGTWMMSFMNINHYLLRVMCVVVGTVVLALGITITVSVNVIMNSGEAFVKAVSDRWGREFGQVKILFDTSCVSLSVIMSLLFFNGKIVGTREGTVIAAVFTGVCVKQFMKLKKNLIKM